MKTILPFAALLVALIPVSAPAHGPHVHAAPTAPQRPPANAQIIAARSVSQLKRGMKQLASGLGVKCERCHDEDDYASDRLKTKLAARRFLDATLEAPPGPSRDRALSQLMQALGLAAVGDEAEIWDAVDGWKRKPRQRE